MALTSGFNKQKFEFYILSLFLLFAILFIIKVPYSFEPSSKFIGFQTLFSDHFIIIICVIGMFAGLVYFWKFKNNYESGTTMTAMQVTEVTNINFESVTFLATYIVPLACVDLDKERSCLMLVTILVLIGWIYIKTNLFYTNPTLAIWGYHIYKISASNSVENKKDIIVIARKKILNHAHLRFKEIDDDIFLAR
jgi:hypothetical protein